MPATVIAPVAVLLPVVAAGWIAGPLLASGLMAGDLAREIGERREEGPDPGSSGC